MKFQSVVTAFRQVEKDLGVHIKLRAEMTCAVDCWLLTAFVSRGPERLIDIKLNCKDLEKGFVLLLDRVTFHLSAA